MSTIDLTDIPKRYPKLYKHNITFECHHGWAKIIDNLSRDLEKLIDDDMEECYAVQVKEKYGALRLYMSCETDKMSDLIEKAEDLSIHTCEVCGEPGQLMSKFRWLFTRCEKHKDV